MASPGWWNDIPTWINCHHPHADRGLVLEDIPLQRCALCGSTRIVTARPADYWPAISITQSETPRYGGASFRVSKERNETWQAPCS